MVGIEREMLASVVLLFLVRHLVCVAGNYNYRLFGEKNWYGPVEIQNEGEYRSLCVQRWEDDMAKILCKQMGFMSGVTYTMAAKASKGRPAWVVNYLACSKSTKSFDECIQSELSSGEINDDGGCEYGRLAAGVMCFDKVRLSYPHNTNSGKVQVYGEDDFYHDLCRVGFNDAAAMVVCKQLGFTLGKAICCPVYLDGLHAASNTNTTYCSGLETDITDCIGSQLCPTNTADSSVLCSYGDPITDTDTLTFDKNSDGSIVVTKRSHPGYICADGFDDVDAEVFCRSDGYKFGVARRFFPHVGSSFWISRVDCEGTENSLHFCPHTIITNERCVHAASVYCYDDVSTSVTLIGTDSEHSGLVEVHRHGMPGVFCKAGKARRGEAATVCRQANVLFVDGDIYNEIPMSLPESMYRWKINAHCSGNVFLLDACIWEESSVEPLPKQPIKSMSDYCDDSSNPLSVYCYGNVRLGCGFGSNSGVVNMYVGGEWKSVCMHANFTDVEATVACKSLNRGFSRGRALPGNLFARDFFLLTPPVQNLKCDITQQSLFDCESGGVSADSCGDDDLAGVYCFKDDDKVQEELTVDYSSNGRILVYKNGMKSGIDYRQWTDKEARVVCRELGFLNGIAVTVESRSPYRNGACYPTLVEKITCTGSEALLASCTYSFVEQNTHRANYPSQVLDAGVNCFNESFTGDHVRLSGGSKPNYGRFEVKIGGEWGVVCNRKGTVTAMDASNICRAINPDYTFGEPFSSERFSDTTVSRTWSIYMNCDNPYSPGVCFSGHWEQGNISSTENPCGEGTELSVFCYRGVRLSARYGSTSGAVMILPNGIYDESYICADSFGDKEAAVTCGQLGFAQGRAITSDRVVWHLSRGMKRFDVSCYGNETSILDCIRDVESGVCSNNSLPSSVHCFDDEVNIPGNLDIVLNPPEDHNNNMMQHSIVLVYSNGFWGYINAKAWNLEAASVVCTQMGYAKVTYYGNAYVDPHPMERSEFPLVINTIDCDGTERRLEQCNFTYPIYSNKIWDDRVATVLCDNLIETTDTPTTPTTESSDTSGGDKVQLFYGTFLQLMILGYMFPTRT